MTPQEFLDQFGTLAENGVQTLREFVLQLAIQGKLVAQDSSDEPTEELILRCEQERKRLADANKISTKRRLPEVDGCEEEFVAPNGWKWCRINHICDHRLGKMLDKSKNKGTPQRYLRNTNVQWLQFDLTDVKEMRFEDAELDEFEVRCGDLMVCEGGYPGRCAIWRNAAEKMMFQKAIHRVRPLAEIYPEFLLMRLWGDSCRGHLDQYCTGATIKHFTGKELARYAICLPPLAEQQRIVAKVDELMRLCDGLEAVQKQRRGVRLRLNRSSLDRLTVVQSTAQVSAAWQRVCDHFEVLYDTPETLPDLRQTILQLAVQGKLVKQDPHDEPAEELLNRLATEKAELVKQKTIPKPAKLQPVNGEVPFPIPPTWRWERLGNITHKIESGWSPQCESYPRTDDNWGVLKISAVTWGTFNPDANKALPAHLEPRPHCEVQAGDFVMSRANTSELVAKSVVIESTPPRLLLNDKLLRVIFPDAIDPQFVNLYNNCQFARDYYIEVASGTSVSMRNVSRDNVGNLLIPIPPLPEQKRIVSKGTDLLSQVTRLESTLTRREATRTQLLTAAIHSILSGAPDDDNNVVLASVTEVEITFVGNHDNDI